MPTFVGIPFVHLRKTVLSPVANVCSWLWPSSERSAARLPFCTVTVTDVPLVARELPDVAVERLAVRPAGERGGRCDERRQHCGDGDDDC